jgi:Predicted pPIWI-associating nuclease
MLDELIADLDAFGAALRRGQSVNVNDQSSKDRAIALATRYFAEARSRILAIPVGAAEIAAHDERWQQLVRLAHGNNARRTHVRTVSQLRRDLVTFRVALLTAKPVAPPRDGRQIAFSTEEAAILKTLEGLVPSAAASYRQGLMDLYGPERLSYRGTAAEFRESVRETLDHLAPDADVQAQAGFLFENGQTRPTQKQKMRHVLQSRGHNKTQRDSAEKSLSLVDELSGDVMRAVYSRASLATHVQTSKAEVRKIKRYVDTLFIDLLEIG